MSYDIVDMHAENTDANFVLEINVMADEGAPTNYWDEQYNYIVSVLDQAYNDNRVPGILGRKVDTDADLAPDNLIDDGNAWLDANIWGDGLYLWVVPVSKKPFACCHESGWDGRHQAFIPTDYYPTKEETTITGIMEALHPYLYNQSCQDVKDEGGGEDDHALGHVHLASNNFGENDEATPLLAGYGKDIAKAGNCDSWDDKEGYTTSLTNCTLRSLEYSWNHAAGNH